MDTPPTSAYILQAINSLKNNKSLGTDGISGEFLNNGGTALHHEVQLLILSKWDAEALPQQWKDT